MFTDAGRPRSCFRSPACCASSTRIGAPRLGSRGERGSLFEQRPERRRLEQAPRAPSASSSSSKIARASASTPPRPPPLRRRASRAARRSRRPRRRSRRTTSCGDDDAVPAVLLQPEHDVVAALAAEAVELAAHAERDRRPGVAAALPHAEAQVLAVADRGEVGELAAVDEQEHAGIAEPERREPAELRAQVEGQLLPGTTASTRVTGRRSSSASTGVGVRGERRGERLERSRRDRQPCGGTVAAEALEVLGAGAPARRAGRTTGPSALSPSSRRPCRRSARPAGCSARRGARRRCRSRPRASRRRRRRSRGGGGVPRATTRSRRSPRAGCAPRPPAARGSAARAPRRARAPRAGSSVSSSSSAASGRHEPPRRVDARREPEADRRLVDRGRVDAGDAHQRLQARLLRLGEPAQPEQRERAVLVDERHDVGDGGERDDVEVALEERVLGAEQRLRRASRRRRCRRAR